MRQGCRRVSDETSHHTKSRAYTWCDQRWRNLTVSTFASSNIPPLKPPFLPHFSISLSLPKFLFDAPLFLLHHHSSSCATTRHRRTRFTTITLGIPLNSSNVNHSFISYLNCEKLISILCRFHHLLLSELPSYFACVL